MSSQWAVALLLGLVLPAAAAAQGQVSKLAKSKGWYTSYPAAREAARQSGKPLLVVFRCEP